MPNWIKHTVIGWGVMALVPFATVQAQPAQCDAKCQAQLRTLVGQLQTLKTQLDRQQAAKQRSAKKSVAKRAKTRKAASRPKRQNYAARKRAPARYSSRARHNRRLTPQQQMLLLQQMQHQQMMFNMFSTAQRSHANMLSENMRIFTARQACSIAGNCRVRVEPYPY